MSCARAATRCGRAPRAPKEIWSRCSTARSWCSCWGAMAPSSRWRAPAPRWTSPSSASTSAASASSPSWSLPRSPRNCPCTSTATTGWTSARCCRPRSAGGGAYKRFIALNDIVLVRGAEPRVVRLKVWMDGHLYNTTVADGIIVSTATGSTAYNLVGGRANPPPQVRSNVLTPLAPHLAADRSLILEPNAVVTLELQQDSANAILSADGQINVRLPSAPVRVSSQRPRHPVPASPPADLFLPYSLRQTRDALDSLGSLQMLLEISIANFAIIDSLLPAGATLQRLHRRDRRGQVDPGRCHLGARRRADRRRRRARRGDRAVVEGVFDIARCSSRTLARPCDAAEHRRGASEGADEGASADDGRRRAGRATGGAWASSRRMDS